MCGIAGVVRFGGDGGVSRAVLERMAEAIVHRGPDEHGIWIGSRVGLTTRRLRVVDLVGGRQPIANEDGSLHLVANGEIYDADERRDALRRAGHVFSTRTDVEVILHAYEADGPACIAALEGMFAFALWDDRLGQLLIARDRFGEKPLYYAMLPTTFLFASELKALLTHPAVPRELDWAAVARYLTHEYVPSPHAIFRAVRKLPPAHWMTVDAQGRVRTTRYWSPPMPEQTGPSERQAAGDVLSLLGASVRRRTSCDVPWGTFLSGGVDSSLVTALAVPAASTAIKTFAIGFEEPSYDETRHASRVARWLGTEHRDIVLRGRDAPDLLGETARVFDEPFADATVVAALQLSRLAREHVTVVLTGDGGDELFCGYPTQTAHRVADVYERAPLVMRRLLTAAAERLPTSHRYLSFDFALRRFVREADRSAAERHLRWMGSFAPETLRALLTPDAWARLVPDDPYADAYAHLARLLPRTTSDVATALDLVLYLAEDNLVQSDRTSMACALELRAPFLDRALAEYVLRLPVSRRRGLWQTKPLLRRAARAVLPRDVARRGKHGFGIPTGSWLRGPLRPLVEQMLAPARLRRQGVFDERYVTPLWRRHLSGAANHRKELWTLLMFQLWAATYWGA